MIKEISAKSVLHFHDQTFATNWDVNIYRGCGHGCTYCFARYSHRYLENADFFNDIFVKTNVAEVLDREMSRKSWRKLPVNVGGVTDAYQPAEEKYRLMPKVLRVFIKHRNPMVIVTKSILPLRDIDLIGQLAKIAEVNVRVSVSTLDEKIRKITEPDSPPASDRLNMLGAFREAGCRIGVLIMPVIPMLTDSEENLRAIFEMAQKNRVNFVETGTLHLRVGTRDPFMEMVRKNFPDHFRRMNEIYSGPNADESYKNFLQPIIRKIKSEYSPWPVYTPPVKVAESGQDLQLSLF